MRPIIKVMLAQGVTLAYVTELLKSLMVDVAQTDFSLECKAATDSRISLMNGVHRKDVSRLRTQLSSSQEHTPKVVSLGTQLVAVWVVSRRAMIAEAPRRVKRLSVSADGRKSPCPVRAGGWDVGERVW